MAAPSAVPLPMPLTYAESVVLQHDLDEAITRVTEHFLKTAVVRSSNGVPLGGPDPRAVEAEVLLALARRLARAGLDAAGAGPFEAKIAALEAQLRLREDGDEICARMAVP